MKSVEFTYILAEDIELNVEAIFDKDESLYDITASQPNGTDIITELDNVFIRKWASTGMISIKDDITNKAIEGDY